MRIRIVTPAPPGSRSGNRVTSLRWARCLRRLGHEVRVGEGFAGEPCDLLIALHALRSHGAVLRYREERPEEPLIVALTGTDLYRDITRDARARRSLDLADRLVVLQEKGLEELPERLRRRARVIPQSVDVRRIPRSRSRRGWRVCVLGHLRPVKDPFRTAMAARRLPGRSRIDVVQIGAALTPAMARRARAEEQRSSRYRWLGEMPRWRALRWLARARLMVLSSAMEGGANVIGESVSLGVPVLTTSIPGSLGLLGEGYPGTFPPRDTGALTALLLRCEEDQGFLRLLEERCAGRRHLFDPEGERRRWRQLLAEL